MEIRIRMYRTQNEDTTDMNEKPREQKLQRDEKKLVRNYFSNMEKERILTQVYLCLAVE